MGPLTLREHVVLALLTVVSGAFGPFRRLDNRFVRLSWRGRARLFVVQTLLIFIGATFAGRFARPS